ncbi:MAG: hypothetical protein WA695_01285 [Candidatus Dormiibacterota bacterium]
MKTPSNFSNRIRRFRRPVMWLIAPPIMLALGLSVFAIWTSTSQSSEQITAGSGPSITLSSTSPNVVTNNGETLTFTPYADAQPTFTAGDEDVNIANNGLATATIDSFTVVGTPSTGANSTALNNELSICVANAESLKVLYNGPLSGVSALTSLVGTPNINGQSSAGYIVNVYAGDSLTYCGSTPVGSAPPLAGADYPNFSEIDAVSSAPVLANDAQAGVDTVSVSITYQ